MSTVPFDSHASRLAVPPVGEVTSPVSAPTKSPVEMTVSDWISSRIQMMQDETDLSDPGSDLENEILRMMQFVDEPHGHH